MKLKRKLNHFFTRLCKFIPFAHGKRSGVEQYLRIIDNLMELEETGTLLIDHRQPGVVIASDYFTLWSNAYLRYGDDRVLHAWCDKFRAAINLRRGKRYGANGEKFPPVMPSDPIFITVVQPDDYSIPYIIGYETAQEVEFKFAPPINKGDTDDVDSIVIPDVAE